MNTSTVRLSPLNDSLPTSVAELLAQARPGAQVLGYANLLPAGARRLFTLLSHLQHGVLIVQTPDGEAFRLGNTRPAEPIVRWRMRDWRLADDILARGDIAFGEAFVEDRWETDDLPQLLSMLNRNRDVIAQAVYGQPLALLWARIKHAFRANTERGSRRNIMAHYDLGNDFYAEWLDSTMSYSSALYSPRSTTLEAAQQHKLNRILDSLNVQPGDTILEIGCGWGGFAEAAARRGAFVTGVTLSPAQLAFAQKRMDEAGLSELVHLSLTDYRALRAQGQQYDHVVSIEMFEAVGERYWPEYFATLHACLKPGGKALIQTITIDDALFASYRKGTDFIQQHVFPGGMLPSPQQFSAYATRAGLSISDDFRFGKDYTATLAEWRQRFLDRWSSIATQGFDERFRRLWLFYLAYCEAGFATGSTDVIQFRLERP